MHVQPPPPGGSNVFGPASQARGVKPAQAVLRRFLPLRQPQPPTSIPGYASLPRECGALRVLASLLRRSSRTEHPSFSLLPPAQACFRSLVVSQYNSRILPGFWFWKRKGGNGMRMGGKLEIQRLREPLPHGLCRSSLCSSDRPAMGKNLTSAEISRQPLGSKDVACFT